MAENEVASEPFEAEGVGAMEEVCEPVDFQSFEDEIRELICPKETKRVALLRTISGDLDQIQADEILALKAIFDDDLRMVDESTAKYFKIKINPIAEECHEDEVVDLWFCLPSQYPIIPPIFEIEGHGCLSSGKADELYSVLMKEADSRLNTLMIYDLITVAQEFVQEIMANVREKKKKEIVCKEPKPEEVTSDDVMEESKHYTISHSGIDLRDTQIYIGHIHNVLKKVPSHLKIQSLENIMKYSLVYRFNDAWEKISKKYEKESRKFPREYVTTPMVAFHGTRQGNVPSIVRNGLLVPGGKSGIDIAHGSSLGIGIYLSPFPEFSFGYCDNGGKVLVCAVLQGRVYRYGEGARLRNRQYDCITYGDEMVIFDARHVLPCYVITLVPHESKVSVDENLSKTLDKARESKDERLQRIAARAKKFFPYGFGPGKNIQILDAADSDDDEDEGGSYQTERYEGIPVSNEYQHDRDRHGYNDDDDD